MTCRGLTALSRWGAVVAFLFLASCRSVPPPAPGAPTEALAHYATAQAYLAQRKLAEAQSELEAAVRLDPNAVQIYETLAKVRTARGDLDGALSLLHQAEQRFPNHPDLVRLIASMYALQGRLEEAARTLRFALQRHPAHPKLSALLAEVHLGRDQVGPAIEVVQASLERSSTTDVELVRVAGRAILESQRADRPAQVRQQGRALLERCRQRVGTDVEVARIVADLYATLNERDAARAILRPLLDADPYDPTLRSRLVRLYLADQKLSEAIELLDRVIRRGVLSGGTRRQLARLLMTRASTNEVRAAHSDWERAAELLRMELKAAPRLISVRAELARALLALGKLSEAVEVLAGIPESMDSAGARMVVARWMLRGANTNDVVQQLRSLAQSASPATAKVARGYLAELLWAIGRTDEAAAEWEALVRTEPPDAAAVIRLAAFRWDRGDAEGAHRCLQDGLRGLSNHVGLLRARAMLHMLQRQFDAALRIYEEIETLTPEDAMGELLQVKVEQAIALQFLGRPSVAARRLFDVWEPVPHAIELFIRLAFDYGRRLGLHDRTVATFDALARQRPMDPVVFMYRGLWASTAERYEEAVQAFEQAERIARQYPGGEDVLTPMFYFSYGGALERCQRYVEAEQLLEKAIQMDPDLAEAWNYLAYMWAERGEKLERAMQYVEEALRREPDNGAYLDTRGWILYQQGRYADALRDLERAAQVMPEEDATVLDHIGDALDKLGRRAEAIERWKRAWVLDPKNDSIRKKLEDHGVDLELLRREAEEVRKRKEAELQRLLTPLETQDSEDSLLQDDEEEDKPE